MSRQDRPYPGQRPEPRAFVVPLLALSALCGLVACDSAVPAIDLIVAGDVVITMDQENSLIRNGAVAVDDGWILAVGPYDEITKTYRAQEVLDGAGKVVLPGLINSHTHAAMSLLRGIADDKELMDWLVNYMFPVEVRFVDEEFVRIGTELACWEMIRGGTTTFVDMYYFNDSVAEAVENCGLRAVIATSVIDQPSPDAADAQEGLQRSVAFIERWQGKNNRIIPVMGVHGVFTVKPAELRAVREMADRLGVPAVIHVSESPSEMQTTMDTYGTTPIGLLESLGFFNGPTLAAHVVWPREDEINATRRAVR